LEAFPSLCGVPPLNSAQFVYRARATRPRVFAMPGTAPSAAFSAGRASSGRYRFGPFEVDFRTGELRKSGLLVHTQDQPLQVLSILLSRSGEIATREEFRALLWPAHTFVDFDHGLNAAIKRLRHLLEDDPENPRYIETLPRHRFLQSRLRTAARPVQAAKRIAGVLRPRRSAGSASRAHSRDTQARMRATTGSV